MGLTVIFTTKPIAQDPLLWALVLCVDPKSDPWRCSVLNQLPQLMSVHLLGDNCAAVTDEPGKLLDRDAALEGLAAAI
jgi:hypothetical protein